jgi:hypothetical protein
MKFLRILEQKSGIMLSPFEDALMEHRFQKHFISTILPRSAPVMCYLWLPISGAMRLFWLIYALSIPNSISVMEHLLSVLHILMFAMAIILHQTRWSDHYQARAGLATSWIIRGSALVIGAQQIGANHCDPQVMGALVGFSCIGGLGIPSFFEHFITTFLLALARPLRLHFFPESDLDLAWQSLIQHTLIFMLGTSISATAHSDCRRDWLRYSSTGSNAPLTRFTGGSQAMQRDDRIVISGDLFTLDEGNRVETDEQPAMRKVMPRLLEQNEQKFHQ